MRNALLFAVPMIGTVAAFAHTGVQNAAVLDRMNNMSAMGDQMEVVVPMARGAAPFDAAAATAALLELAALAAASPDLFRAPEQDPRSEARPAIWEDFPDFEARSEALRALSEGAAGRIETPSDLVAAVRRIGATCSDCHRDYRLEN